MKGVESVPRSQTIDRFNAKDVVVEEGIRDTASLLGPFAHSTSVTYGATPAELMPNGRVRQGTLHASAAAIEEETAGTPRSAVGRAGCRGPVVDANP